MKGNQYTVISTKEELLSYYNKLLTSHPSYKSGVIGGEAWEFSKRGYTQTIDFKWLRFPELASNIFYDLEVDGNNIITLDTKQFVQILMLELIDRNKVPPPQYYQVVLQLVMQRNKLEGRISHSSIAGLLNAILTTRFSDDGLFHTPSLMSHVILFDNNTIKKTIDFCLKYNIDNFIDTSIGDKKLNVVLNNELKELFDITLAQYKKGGTFNFLGLETGQLYADFLAQRFYENHLYSTICLKVLNDIIPNLEHSHQLPKKKKSLNTLISSLLQGAEFTPKFKAAFPSKRTMSGELYRVIPNVVNKFFIKHFNDYRLEASAFNPQTIEKMVEGFGLAARYDASELFRSIAICRFHHKDDDEAERILKRYQEHVKVIIEDSTDFNAILPTGIDFTKVSIQSLYEIMDSLAPPKLNKKNVKEYLSASYKNLMFGDDSFQTYFDFSVALNRVTDAGSELMLTYTGWRGSEYGFSLDNIHKEENTDIIDSAYIPFRFHVNWYVYKTSGKARLNREITSCTYILAEQIAKQHGTDRDLPCLFEFKQGLKFRDKAPNEVQAYNNTSGFTGKNWQAFITHYKPFVDVDVIDSKLSGYKALTGHYRSVDLELLREIKTNLNDSLSRYEVVESTKGSKETNGERVTLSTVYFTELQNGQASNSEVSNMYNKYMSESSLQWLRSQSKPFRELDENVRKKFTKTVNDEIREGLVYPTPHSWRHVWAEAVLTRYEGDIGAVIRHNFKHMSHRFFMAYIRDKADASLFTRAKRTALNNLVQKRLIELEDENPNYVGGFNQFIKKTLSLRNVRIVKNTDELTPSEKRLLAEQISGRVIHFNTDAFANCLPRKGKEGQAKCNQYGDIRPQDACIQFCIGCINADINSGHAKGIIQRITPMIISVLDNAAAPFELPDHIDTFHLAKRRLVEICDAANKKAIDNIIPHIDKAIDKAKICLEEFVHEFA
ncbi:hypothetical protein BIZ37_04360 [Photobacterium sp. BZF1]|uniref:hypothetical protein n=1 Tax=Photobacterium sp. BZF1 TaxID=1904457 RepID=UPI00165379A0|nr:hypothetical protein [Photobacterium sp. BZF1]MBC7001777.1 hypothetical protein [Photobacterium sp. BZF1]